MNDTNTNSKSISGAMKFLKISAIGTMLLSVGSTYAFNGNAVFAKTSLNDSGKEVSVETSLTNSDYAALTESLSLFSYNDVRADHYAYSSIEWAASKNLFNDGGKSDFNPSSKVTESELVSVIANYFNINNDYSEFAKYQLSLNGYSDTNLRSHYVKMGEFAQIVSELTNNQRGNLDESLSYLNKSRVIDVGTINESESISDLAGSEILLDKAQLAVLMQKVDRSHLTISNESKSIYNSNKDSSMESLTATINKNSVVPVAQITASKSSKSNITTVSNSNEPPSGFVIGDGSTNITKEDKEKSKESDEKYAHDQLIEKYMNKIEQDRPPVKGAKIKNYTNISTSNYVKNNKLYEYYKVSWTKTNKVIYVGVPVRTASSYDIAIYSTSGNHVDSRAKLTANQKKIINTLVKSRTYSKKYRYIVVYRDDSVTKATDLYVIPKSGKTAAYELQYYHNFSFDSTDSLTIPNSKSVKAHNDNLKIAYDLYILTHKATLKEWQKAMGGGYKSNKLFYGYGIVGANIATKTGK